MLFHHVGLKIDPRTKHNKFAGLATRVRTWVVRLLKVLLLEMRTIRYWFRMKGRKRLTNAS
jgi:hypothetical protein